MQIHDVSGWTIFIFGAFAFLFGLLCLIRPVILFALGFEVVNRSTVPPVITYFFHDSFFNGFIQYKGLLSHSGYKRCESFYLRAAHYHILTFEVFTTIGIIGFKRTFEYILL